MRIMILGDRIWGTSAYSKVVWHTANLLQKMGHTVAHIPMGRSMTGGMMTYHGTLIYPSGDDPWGEDVALKHYLGFRADMLVVIKDVWVLNSIPRLCLNFTPMVPVDHSPVSPSITSRLETPFRTITISRFGQRELAQKQIPSTYIPHGVQTDLYKPLGKRAECRKLWMMSQDDFIVGIVSLNRARKNIPRMLRVYKRFLELNPDVKTHCFLWTDVRGAGLSGISEDDVGMGVSDVSVNLLPEIMQLGLGEKVMWPEERAVREGVPEWQGDNYESGWDMIKMFNCFDVLLGTTGGEGFFMPGLEAQACGCPIVVTDYSAAPEILGAGYTVGWDDYVITNSPGTRYALVDIDKGAEALAKVMNSDRERMARRASAFAERFSWDRIAEQYWKPFLEDCESELRPLVTSKGLSHW